MLSMYTRNDSYLDIKCRRRCTAFYAPYSFISDNMI